MENKTPGIIATIATALLCGCPGLFLLCSGAITSVVSFIPGADIDILGSTEPRSALLTGLGALFLGGLFVAIPVVVGIVTLRKKAPPPVIEEPIPPPS